MSISYYVYYRVDPARAAVGALKIDRLLHMVRTGAGVTGRVLKKRGEPNLWMEVYDNVPDPAKFEWTLEAAVKELAAVEFLQTGTGRHIECFED